MTSLEIINEIIGYIKDYQPAPLLSLEKLNKIKQDLEILQLIIKWKDLIYIKQNYEYLLNNEIVEFDSDIKLVNNYLRHFTNSYVPRCFRYLKD